MISNEFLKLSGSYFSPFTFFRDIMIHHQCQVNIQIIWRQNFRLYVVLFHLATRQHFSSRRFVLAFVRNQDLAFFIFTINLKVYSTPVSIIIKLPSSSKRLSAISVRQRLAYGRCHFFFKYNVRSVANSFRTLPMDAGIYRYWTASGDIGPLRHRYRVDLGMILLLYIVTNVINAFKIHISVLTL